MGEVPAHVVESAAVVVMAVAEVTARVLVLTLTATSPVMALGAGVEMDMVKVQGVNEMLNLHRVLEECFTPFCSGWLNENTNSAYGHGVFGGRGKENGQGSGFPFADLFYRDGQGFGDGSGKC